MAQGYPKNIYLPPNIEGIVVDIDKRINHHRENIEDLENILIKQKLATRNIELNTAKHKLCALEREIRLLHDRNKQLEKEKGVVNESPDTMRAEETRAHYAEKVYYIGKKNVCLHSRFANEDAEMSALYKTIDNLTEETRSLKRKINIKDIEINQLRFRNKILDDTLKESKLGKNIELCDVLYEQAYLQEHMKFLQEDNAKKDEELSKARLDLKKAQEWKEHITADNCTLNVKLTEHEEEIRKLRERIKYVMCLKDECQGVFDQSLRKEADLSASLLQLAEENEKKENELEICKQEMERDKDHSSIEMTKLRRQIQCCKLKIEEKESELERLGAEFKNQAELKEKEENKLRDIISKSFKDILNLENELEKRNVEIAVLEHVAKQNDQMKQALNQSHENEVVVRKYVKELTSTLHEKGKHISELKQQLNTASETLENIQSEFQDIQNSTEKKEESGKDQYNLEVNQEKQQQATNKMQTKSTRKHRDCEMENEERVENRKETRRALVKSAETKGALRKTINELQIIGHSLKMEKKKAEENLRQCEQEIEHEKEQLHIMKLQMCKEIEGLKKELTQKEATLQEVHSQYEDSLKLHEETEVKLNGIIINKDIQIQKFSEDIKKKDLENKETERQLKEICKASQQKESELRNLNSQINETSETFSKKETELKIINRSLQTQLNTTKGELEQLHKDLSHDQAIYSTNQKHMVGMGKEIEKLKQDLEHKEITLQEHKVQYDICIKIKQEEELKLNAIIEEQKCLIQYLKEDNKKQDTEVNSIEEKQKQKDQVQEALDAFRVKDATLCKSGRVFEIKNRDEEVTDLKKQLDYLRKKSNQKDNELKNNNISLKQQLNIKEKELRRKEVEHLNVKALIGTKDKHEMAMAEEIERLKEEVKLKETMLQECNVKLKDAVKVKEGTESNLKEIIIKHNEDINNLKVKIETENVNIDEVENRSKQIQQALNESHKKEAEQGRTIDILQRRDKENVGQIRELKDQMNELSNTSKRNENQLQSMISSLQTQLEKSESKLKELHQGKLHEKESLSTYKKQMVGLNKEIENLKQEVKLKDARIHEYDIQCKNALKTKQEAEYRKEIINKQNNEIQHLQKQIEKKDIEANDIAELKKHGEEVERAFNDLYEKEAVLRKSNKDLHCRNKETEDEIRELKKQLSDMLKTTSQKENESKQIIHSIEQELKNTEANMRQQQFDISQKKKLMDTKDKDMVKMTEEIKSLKLQVKQKESTLQKCSEKYKDVVKLKHETEWKLNEIIHDHKTEIRHLQEDNDRKDNKIARIEQINISYEKVQNTLNESQEKEVTFRETIKKVAGLDETKSRLSRVMGDELTDNNPNITDLSDRNRPTKVAEKCAELYNNEWTDALYFLVNLLRTEEAAIEALLLILKNVMNFCKTMAQRQIEIIEREMYFADETENIAVSSHIQKIIKDRRKATASDVVGNLKKIYVAQVKQSKDKIMRAALDVEPYTSECIEICWFMVIQDPPVVFAPLPIKDSSFDSDFYEPYTNSGTHIDFAVWPALLLHDGGPILAKGVAQGYEYI